MIIHNLDEIIYLLSDSAPRRDEVTALCTKCSAVHEQTMNTCPDCQEDVVWRNSLSWKRIYGDPDRYIRSKTVDLRPLTPLEVQVVRAFGRAGQFQNISQMKQFRRLRAHYADGYLEQMLAWAKLKGWNAFAGGVENSSNYDRWVGQEAKQVGLPGDELYGD
jgi:hypothetical protein